MVPTVPLLELLGILMNGSEDLRALTLDVLFTYAPVTVAAVLDNGG